MADGMDAERLGAHVELEWYARSRFMELQRESCSTAA